MNLVKRVSIAVVIALLFAITLYYRPGSTNVTIQKIGSKGAQAIGLGDYFESERHYVEDQGRPKPLRENLNFTDVPTYSGSKGDPSLLEPIPAGAVFTRNLVMAKMKSENISWLDEHDLGPEITKMIYMADDPKAPLHPPKNKGNEVMSYLTYIIDFYDELPDVSVFMHSHRYAWHNNDLLNWDSAEMIKRLSSERVIRHGYMNLRCHWNPGCPQWIHPGRIDVDKDKIEQSFMASAWPVLFPDKPIPAVLAQPCCSQFALSRDRIRATPRERYKHYRNWLLKSDIRNSMTGRVFEYLWQAIFTDESVFCPNQRTCYCDGYGVCFETEKSFDYWFELRWARKTADEDLAVWQEKADKIEKYRTGEGRLRGIAIGDLEVPELGKKEELEAFSETTFAQMEKMRLEALQRGTDPRIRAESAGRTWREGDGF